MTTYDNSPPPTDWRPEPRPCPVFDFPKRVEVITVGEHIELGEN